LADSTKPFGLLHRLNKKRFTKVSYLIRERLVE
jgi:hypothetical protein